MGQRSKNALAKNKPEFLHTRRLAKADGTAAGALEDAAEEGGLQPARGPDNSLYVEQFEIGKCYWFETMIWVYLGKVVARGVDYVVIGEACRMHSDGRHHVMMAEGRHDDMEVETTGCPQRIMRIPIDWIGPSCEWPHPIPPESV